MLLSVGLLGGSPRCCPSLEQDCKRRAPSMSDDPPNSDTKLILDQLDCDREDGVCDLTLMQLMERTSLPEQKLRNGVAKLLALGKVEIYRGNLDEVWVAIPH